MALTEPPIISNKTYSEEDEAKFANFCSKFSCVLLTGVGLLFITFSLVLVFSLIVLKTAGCIGEDPNNPCQQLISDFKPR